MTIPNALRYCVPHCEAISNPCPLGVNTCGWQEYNLKKLGTGGVHIAKYQSLALRIPDQAQGLHDRIEVIRLLFADVVGQNGRTKHANEAKVGAGCPTAAVLRRWIFRVVLNIALT